MIDNKPMSFSIDAGGSEYTVSLKAFFRVLWQRLWVIVLATIMIFGSTLGYGLSQTPIYEASAEVLVGSKQDGEDPVILPTEISGLQQITLTVVEAINSQRVAEAVVDKLGLQLSPEAVQGGLIVEQVTDTQFVRISYRDSDPQRAQMIANAVADVSSKQLAEVNSDTVAVAVWERAVVPETPISPDLIRNGIFALVLGMMLGAGLAFVLEYLDDSWRSPEELEEVSGVPTLGMVPKFKASTLRRKAIKKGGL